MFLLDTNIFLELLLDREHADDIERFLRTAAPGTLFLSEFSLCSIGIFLLRQKMHQEFLGMVDDLMKGGVRPVRLGPGDMRELVKASVHYNLDFDDAYQYAVSEKCDLTIVSLDTHFDRTPRGRKAPEDIHKAP